jgi:hypothetical protein
MPSGLSDAERTHEFLKRLDKNLSDVLAATREYQQKQVEERLKVNPAVPLTYKPTDLILLRTEKMRRADKLVPTYLGPYEVISHTKNDIRCKHLHQNDEVVLQAEQVKPFFGSKEDAFHVALNDHNQYVVKRLIGWKGTPLERSTCSFKILWADNSESWHPFDTHNITDTSQYEQYVNAVPELLPLRFLSKDYPKAQTAMRKLPVTLQKGDKRFVDMRSFGQDWLDSCNIPDSDDTQFVAECLVTRVFSSPASNPVKNAFSVKFPVFGPKAVDRQQDWILCWGQHEQIPPGAVLVDAAFIDKYPQILGD